MAASMSDSDSLQQSSKGACRTLCQTGGQVKQTHFFCFQDRQRPPPKHPSIVKSRDKILGHQSSVAESHSRNKRLSTDASNSHESVKPLITNCWRCALDLLDAEAAKTRSLRLTMQLTQSILHLVSLSRKRSIDVTMASLFCPKRGETAANPMPVISFRLSFNQSTHARFCSSPHKQSDKMDEAMTIVVCVEATFILEANARPLWQRQHLCHRGWDAF